MSVAYLALGSNLGDRAQHLAAALVALRATAGVRVERVSSWYETAPVGGPAGQGAYLNGAAQVTTTLPPEALLAALHAIEAAQGRVRTEQDAPRTLDLDLLLYDDLVRDADPVLPHPRMHERLFVLEPLAEIAPGAVHPGQNVTVAELRASLLGLRPAGPTPGRELRGLRALVTGSSSGIGRAIALALAAAGADVIVHANRSRTEAETVATLARHRSGGRAEVLLADLAQADAVSDLAGRAWHTWGGLDLLVNNAGVDTLTGDAANWSFDAKLAALLRVDVAATMTLSRLVGTRIQERGAGVILNIGWDQADTGMEGTSGELFAATKGAVMAFTRSLALSLAPQVRVHCLAPGWIRTAWGEQASESWQERVRRETPLLRWGLPEDVATLAVFLCGPGATYLTGQTYYVNGGAVR